MAAAALSPRTVVIASACSLPFQGLDLPGTAQRHPPHASGLEASAGSAVPQIAKDP